MSKRRRLAKLKKPDSRKIVNVRIEGTELPVDHHLGQGGEETRREVCDVVLRMRRETPALISSATRPGPTTIASRQKINNQTDPRRVYKRRIFAPVHYMVRCDMLVKLGGIRVLPVRLAESATRQ